MLQFILSFIKFLNKCLWRRKDKKANKYPRLHLQRITWWMHHISSNNKPPCTHHITCQDQTQNRIPPKPMPTQTHDTATIVMTKIHFNNLKWKGIHRLLKKFILTWTRNTNSKYFFCVKVVHFVNCQMQFNFYLHFTPNISTLTLINCI